MTRNRTLATAVLAAMLDLVAAFAHAATETVDGIIWTYTVSDGKARIYKGYSHSAIPSSTAGAIVIPSTLGGYPVTSIGNYAFWDCIDLTSVTIPDSVTSIENHAFYNCSGLASVTIGTGVTSIGYMAFSSCVGLMSISVDARNTRYSSENGLLLSKDGKTLVQGVNGDVTIPDSVTSISDWAFAYCSWLTSVAIPHSLTSIGYSAFYSCVGLMSISVDTRNPSYSSENGLLLSKDGKTLVQGVNGDVTIPDSVTRIGSSAFNSYSGLTSVTIPGSVTSIGPWAFGYCYGLTSITIPGSVTSIGNSAFEGCSGLTSVTIPDSVTSIDGSAFVCCDGLTSIRIPDSVTSIGVCPFGNCARLMSISVDERNPNYSSENGLLLSKDGKTLIQGVNGDVTIPDSVTSIGYAAFDFYSGLTSVTIPDTVTNIGICAFAYCDGLTSVTIPDSVTSIGAEAFVGCYGLTSVTIPVSVTSIGEGAFAACGRLATVYLPASYSGGMDWCPSNVTIVRYYCMFSFDASPGALPPSSSGPFLITSPVSVYGEIADFPTPLPRIGYSFGGWSLYGETITPESVVTETTNHVLTAVWMLAADEPTVIVVDGVTIECDWLDKFPMLIAESGGSREAAASATAANGENKVWECYVAGLNPTNAAAAFRTVISWENGVPVIGWEPKLPPEEAVMRNYTEIGKTNLNDGCWTPVTGANRNGMRFFKVKVEMK